MIIQGTVLFNKDLPSFSGAELHIRLEDTGRADAGADILHQETLPGISHRSGEDTRIDFQFVSDESGNNHPKYNLRAHADLSGNGQIEKGDMVTTQSYPVLPGETRKQELRMKKV